MSAFAWLSELVHWFGRFFPRLVLVRRFERGVKYLPGGRVKLVKAGLTWFWPLTSYLAVFSVVRSVSTTQRQTLTTADGRAVVVSGLAWYEVVDPIQWHSCNYNAETNVDEMVCAAIRRVVIQHTFDDLIAMRSGLDLALRDACSTAAALLGVRFGEVSLVDFAQVRPVNLVGGALSSINLSTH